MEWFQTEDFWRDFYPCVFYPERFAAAKDEIGKIMNLTQCSQGSVLDLCCGPGRHSVEFAHRGFQVTGVDGSSYLLDRAREYAAQSDASVEWIREDMRSFVRPAAYDLICNLATSFGYFENEQDDLAVLRNVHKSLKETGVFVIDVISKEILARAWENTKCWEFADGLLLVQRRQLRDDWCRVPTEWILIKDGHVRSFTFEHTIYSGRELKDRLLAAGFRQVQLFGDLAGSPYNRVPARLVAVARKS